MSSYLKQGLLRSRVRIAVRLLFDCLIFQPALNLFFAGSPLMSDTTAVHLEVATLLKYVYVCMASSSKCM